MFLPFAIRDKRNFNSFCWEHSSVGILYLYKSKISRAGLSSAKVYDHCHADLLIKYILAHVPYKIKKKTAAIRQMQ